ncbi:hypothetical protein C8R45DRAFT_166830 [Mycena sanguinolenta]|nr:hypothetical protein C8R45DRAFT_166830 [Mycena sanguinolenta]
MLRRSGLAASKPMGIRDIPKAAMLCVISADGRFVLVLDKIVPTPTKIEKPHVWPSDYLSIKDQATVFFFSCPILLPFSQVHFMAITPRTQHRRNSAVLLANAPLPLCPQTAPPLNDGPNLTAKPTRRVPRKAAGGKSVKSALVAAEPVLFFPDVESIPPLLTPTSCFPSRTLPPLGVRASHLDTPGARVFKVGDKVRVRLLNISGPKEHSWSKWARGRVVRYKPMRTYAGSYGHAYRVAVEPAGKRVAVENDYAQFMGEICPDDTQDYAEDFLTPEQSYIRRRKADWVYARIQISDEDIWTPAEVISWDQKNGICVMTLAGPTAGRVLNVTEALPYTSETAIACRQQGQKVFCRGQELFLQDVPVRPLEMADDPPVLGPIGLQHFTMPAM